MGLIDLSDEQLGARVRSTPLWGILLEMEKEKIAPKSRNNLDDLKR